MNELIRQVTEANRMLPRERLAILTWGNVSGISEDRTRVAVKSSGIDYASMTERDITLTDLDGNVLSGGAPSTDLPTHLALYRAFPSAGAVVHIHSTYATMWAQAGKAIPCLGTTHADYFYGEIPCTRELTAEEIGTPADRHYEENTGKVIVEAFSGRDPSKVPAVLVKSHGPFTWGPDPATAVKTALVLEYIAKMAYLNKTLDQSAPDGISPALLDKHYCRKFGGNAYYGQKKSVSTAR
jgi:L-ribulose-5-phosphate 4-epimerase